MSRPRGLSEASKTPHSVGLKVLRLSKPSLALQFPIPTAGRQLPKGDEIEDELLHIDASAAYSHPAATTAGAASQHDGQFILSPLLALPPAFGVVHVGETFSCTLCATNELTDDTSSGGISVGNVRLTAEIQTPSRPSSVPIEVHTGQGPSAGEAEEDDDDEEEEASTALQAGETLQRIVRYDLREEGNHVLIVTVSYSETPASDPAANARQRSFRKLYQFPAHQLLSVRTKARILPPKHNSIGPESFVLEAQLENLDEKLITLERIVMHPRDGLTSRSLNAWDVALSAGAKHENPTLAAGAILQAAFRIEGTDGQDVERVASENEEDEKRVVLGHLNIGWRSQMGEAGSLNTGWLTWKQR